MKMTRGCVFVSTCLVLSMGAMPHAEAAEQPYQVEWTAQIGTTRGDYGHSVALDAVGNAYISGYTEGNLDGPNVGLADAFLTKFDTSGNELWSTQIDTTSYDRSNSVVVDAAGNVYISGHTQGNLGGSNAGGNDAFLIKFDPSGAELWTKQIGTMSDDRSYSVAVDTTGNAYISGWTKGNLGGTNAGLSDAFLIKFDTSGTELWTKQIGTMNDDKSWSVAVDAAGNAYISGSTDGSLGGTNAGLSDAFLTKFDPMGTELWSTQIGTTWFDYCQTLAVDAAGNAYISGWTKGNLGGPNSGRLDAFLVKFAPSGTELWSTQIGTTTDDYSLSLAVDAAGNAYINGDTGGSLGGPNAGSYDAFLAKFDPSGNELWTKQIGTSSEDHSRSVAVDAAGNAYISGYTGGSLGGPNAGDADAFLTKFAIPEPASLVLLVFGTPVLLRRR